VNRLQVSEAVGEKRCLIKSGLYSHTPETNSYKLQLSIQHAFKMETTGDHHLHYSPITCFYDFSVCQSV